MVDKRPPSPEGRESSKQKRQNRHEMMHGVIFFLGDESQESF